MKSIGISSCTTRRGFSLTELAVVLGVAGAILGSVWAVATAGWENTRQAAFTADIGIIVTNIRAYYGSQNGITGLTTVLTPQLASLTPPLIPGNMLRANGVNGCVLTPCADSPWGPRNVNTSQDGSLAICAWNPAVPGCAAATEQYFAIDVVSLPVSSCVHAAVVNSGAEAPPGLYDVDIGGQSMLALNDIPVTPSVAQKWCTAGSTIYFVFRLTTPMS